MAQEENERQKKSREKFINKLREIQKKAYGQILDQVESVVVALSGNPESFLPLRGKILRASNDAIRQLEKELERSYILEYESLSEDVIVIQNKQ
jgi:hypothetical protein